MLKFYSDELATQELSPTEYFIGNGATTQFSLTKFEVADMSALYVEDIVDIDTVTFNNGVGTGTFATTAAYVGYAAYHQYDNSSSEAGGLPCIFRGYVTAGGVNTVTISDTAYDATADKLRLVKYVKKTLGVDYTITVPYTFTFQTGAPANGAKIYALGSSPLSVNFGGDNTAGTLVTTEKLIYLKADVGYVYDTCQIYSDNLTQKLQSADFTGVNITNGVSTNAQCTFPATNSEVGKAVNVNGVFIGIITENTLQDFTCAYDTNLTTPAANIYDATGAAVSVYTVGEFALAVDSTGVAGPYRKVLQNYTSNPDSLPTTFTENDTIGIWVKATVPLPTAAMNYSENVLRVAATEYLA